MPQATPGRPRLADHDRRRTAFRGGPGRTLGGGSVVQRGWLNPEHQLFGQVTSRTRHDRAYDLEPGGLTDTEAPRTEVVPVLVGFEVAVPALVPAVG